MKKFMTILTLGIIVFSIISWGLIGVNIENTEAFNNKNYELSEKVDYDRIKEETGMDLTIFSEDNSPVKIYENKDEVYLVFKEHTLNLSKGLFGNMLIGTFNLVNKLINNINQFIGNYIIM
ncbi:TPA: hypothetical protein I9148_000122 [Clostridium perfringens]|nr:hypothetical protein [Clostridium perfringens]HAT4362660.1 hypothetical protein [Clostridium perfringens]